MSVRVDEHTRAHCISISTVIFLSLCAMKMVWGSLSSYLTERKRSKNGKIHSQQKYNTNIAEAAKAEYGWAIFWNSTAAQQNRQMFYKCAHVRYSKNTTVHSTHRHTVRERNRYFYPVILNGWSEERVKKDTLQCCPKKERANDE